MMKVDELNKEQQCAVEHVEGPLLVIAGAGSGKTRIVTSRIAHLLNICVPASEILAVTFTNKAAEEMKSRVKALTDQQILTSTFHSLGARILRESIHHLGYQSNFSIYDDEDATKVLKECLKSMDITGDKSLIRTLKNGISHAKNNMISPSELTPPVFPDADFHLLKEIYTLYCQKLFSFNALDFDDLLYLTVTLLKNNENVADLYRKRWSFVLVDEYQDTNEAQYTLTKLLCKAHKNLFVVGDPDQSIYSWRGANINNILNFETDFPGAKVVRLEQNYRSTSHILSAANKLIENNESRYDKNLWSALGDGEKVKIDFCENEYEEADLVTSQILDFQMKNVSFNDMAIFYRTNSQSRIFEDRLLKEHIPFVIIGGLSFYQRREIKDILAFLRVACFDTDYVSFSRTINLPKRGFGPAAIEKIKNASERANLPILQVAETLLEQSTFDGIKKLSAKQQSGLREYISIIRKIKESRSSSTLKDIIKNTIENSHYLSVLKEDFETYHDRKENLDELIRKAAEWEHESATPSLEGFLEELTLKSQTDNSQSLECVKLMTIHNGKGLEFDRVFVVGLEEDLFPHVNSKDSPEALEEERRLCYVGMTRAKKSLSLSGAKYRLMWGAPKSMVPSRFLYELDQSHINWKDKEEEISYDDRIFSPGTIVFHKDFGKGSVKKAYETSLGTTYDVFFYDLHATRSLVARFAKLKSI